MSPRTAAFQANPTWNKSSAGVSRSFEEFIVSDKTSVLIRGGIDPARNDFDN